MPGIDPQSASSREVDRAHVKSGSVMVRGDFERVALEWLAGLLEG